MSWRATPFTVPLVIAAAISIALTIVAWRRRRMPGALPFIAMALALAVWTLGYALEVSSTSLARSVFWAKVQYLGITVVPVAWLLFALRYNQRVPIATWRVLPTLAIIPLLTVMLVWTNEQHALVWRTTTLDSTTSDASLLHVTYGVWFWVHTAFSYLCLLAGSARFAVMLLRSRDLYRSQVISLLISVAAPWICNILYITDLLPWPKIDLTPFGFTLSALLFIGNLVYFRLLDLIPVARDMLIERMSDGVVVVDVHNRVVDLNAAARSLLGNDDAIGQRSEQVFGRWPDLVARYHHVVDIADELTIGSGKEQEIFDVRITPLIDIHGNLTGRLLVWRDITERKAIEASLRQSEARYRMLARHLPNVVVFFFDHDLRYLLVEGRALSDYGYNQAQLEGRTIWEVPIAPFEEAAYRAALVGQTRSFEFRNAQGLFFAQFVPIADDDGTIVAGMAVVENITERAQQQTALQNANNTLQSRIDELSALNRITQTVVMRQDLSSVVHAVAEELTGLFNARRASIILLDEQRATLTVAADHRLDAEQDLEGASIHVEALPLTAQLVALRRTILLDQQQIEALLLQCGVALPATPYTSFMLVPTLIQGKIIGAIVLMSKVPDHSFSEDEVHLVETIAGQLAGAITHARLLDVAEQARVAAEGANKAKTQFLAVMSHELRTPLNGILGYTQLLQREAFAAKHQEMLQTIAQSGNHLLTLINDLLDLAKIEAGNIELVDELFDLIAFLSEISAMGQLWTQHKAIAFRLIGPDEVQGAPLPTYVRCDRRRLRQVIFNLLGNAIKFTDVGNVTLRVATRSVTPDGHRSSVRFAVEDSGVGIASDEIALIFAPFHQAGDRARRSEGTGLGLSVCVELLHLMGSELHVTSTLGVGSIFSFDLDLQHDMDNAEHPLYVPAYHSQHAGPIAAHVPLPPHDLAAFVHMLMLGDVRAIQQHASALAQRDSQFQPFANELQRLADDFQLDAIRTYLHAYQTQGAVSRRADHDLNR